MVLQKISKLDAGVIRGLLVASSGLIGQIAVLFGVDEKLFNEHAGKIIDSIPPLWIALGLLWAGYARINLPNPPLSKKAVKRSHEMLAQQTDTPSPPGKESGFVRPLFLACLMVLMMPAVLVSSGCVGTGSAYRAAETPDERAYVIAEHYASLVKEAANLKETRTVPDELIEAMQRAEFAARPLILGSSDGSTPGLRQLSDAYKSLHDAKSEAELRQAIDLAALRIADLVRAVQSARGINQ